jgi:hypothetical protein
VPGGSATATDGRYPKPSAGLPPCSERAHPPLPARPVSRRGRGGTCLPFFPRRRARTGAATLLHQRYPCAACACVTQLRCRPWQWPCIEHPYSGCLIRRAPTRLRALGQRGGHRRGGQALARAARDTQRMKPAARDRGEGRSVTEIRAFADQSRQRAKPPRGPGAAALTSDQLPGCAVARPRKRVNL